MRATVLFRTALLSALATFALASAANAATGRTWVSNAGVDSGACSRAAPCATFQFAYNNTNAGGEIIALDTTGYGPVVITHAITITGLEPALVAVATGTVGITVNAAATDKILLRNLVIVGAPGSSNTTGIRVTGGKVVLANSTLRGLTDGLIATNTTANLRVFFNGVDVLYNTRGFTADGPGANTQLSPPTGAIEVFVAGGMIIANDTGFLIKNPGVDGNGNEKRQFFVQTTGSYPSPNIIGNGVLVAPGTGPSAGNCEFANSCRSTSTYFSSVDGQNTQNPN